METQIHEVVKNIYKERYLPDQTNYVIDGQCNFKYHFEEENEDIQHHIKLIYEDIASVAFGLKKLTDNIDYVYDIEEFKLTRDDNFFNCIKNYLIELKLYNFTVFCKKENVRDATLFLHLKNNIFPQELKNNVSPRELKTCVFWHDILAGYNKDYCILNEINKMLLNDAHDSVYSNIAHSKYDDNKESENKNENISNDDVSEYNDVSDYDPRVVTFCKNNLSEYIARYRPELEQKYDEDYKTIQEYLK